jgi:L-2,4-diaminobutyrate decarboxylase
LKGIAYADSIMFDPHKMMFVPLSAGGVLVRDGAHLTRPLAEQAPYLFGSKRRWPDLGQLTVACSQRFDALQVWMLWCVYGEKIWSELGAHVCDVCRSAFEYCSQSEILAPAHEPHSNIFCFQLRRRFKGSHADRHHWAIKEEINESGFGYIRSTVLNRRRVLRMVIMNPRTTSADARAILRRVEQMAEDLR